MEPLVAAAVDGTLFCVILDIYKAFFSLFSCLFLRDREYKQDGLVVHLISDLVPTSDS